MFLKISLIQGLSYFIIMSIIFPIRKALGHLPKIEIKIPALRSWGKKMAVMEARLFLDLPRIQHSVSHFDFYITWSSTIVLNDCLSCKGYALTSVTLVLEMVANSENHHHTRLYFGKKLIVGKLCTIMVERQLSSNWISNVYSRSLWCMSEP